MKEYGGFFELELLTKDDREYHSTAIKLNSGRNGLKSLLESRLVSKVYLPYYTCDALLEPINRLNIPHEYYFINENFQPIFTKQLEENEVFLYVNYFGIHLHNVTQVIHNYKNAIIDNTQAFFQSPMQGEDTFYSPRKFFGVPDGGYLYTNRKLNQVVERDESYQRCEFLLKRIDTSAQASYEIFKRNEENLNYQDIKQMSKLTQRILNQINYDEVMKIRNENFLYLHQHLSEYNEIKINTDNIKGPLVYPFLLSRNKLREDLIKNKIYVATYWQEVLNKVEENSFESKLARSLLPLPIDQRYSVTDMDVIIFHIINYISNKY